MHSNSGDVYRRGLIAIKHTLLVPHQVGAELTAGVPRLPKAFCREGTSTFVKEPRNNAQTLKTSYSTHTTSAFAGHSSLLHWLVILLCFLTWLLLLYRLVIFPC